MIVFVTWLGSIITAMMTAFGVQASAKLIGNIALLAASLAATAALAATVSLVINGLIYVAPEFVQVGASWVVPSNMGALIGARLSIELSCLTYEVLKFNRQYTAWKL